MARAMIVSAGAAANEYLPHGWPSWGICGR